MTDRPLRVLLAKLGLDSHTIGRVRGAKSNTYTAGIICEKVSRYAERVHHPGRLLLEREHLVGHEARQPQGLPFLGAEPCSLVDAGIPEHLPAPQPGVPLSILLPRGAHARHFTIPRWPPSA